MSDQANALSRRLREAGKRVANIVGIQQQLINDKSRLMVSIAEAEEYLSYKDQVLEVLNASQYEIQSKTQDTIAALLTQLIRDVMPEKEDRVVLEQGLRANKNTLEFEIESPEGKRENIYLDKGGSIQNIVSMGLRFVMLSRTRNRRILCLDEADCWLSPKYIHDFAKIMSELSFKLGVQVIYISHHNAEAFEGLARRIHLSKESGEIRAEILDDHKVDGMGAGLDGDDQSELFEQTGWKYLRLANYRGHGNTFLELSPGLNVITGDNDIGKSAIVDAVNSVVNNVGRDGLIRHGYPEARVEIGFEDNLSLHWSYKRRGAKKTEYRLVDENNVALEYSDSGTEPPVWLHDYLAMQDINGLNIHIGSQDAPNFLIDKSVSSHYRAEALSLNADARHVQAMIRLHGEKSKEARRLINQSQKELIEVKNKLAAIRSIQQSEVVLAELEEAQDGLVGAADALRDLGSHLARLSSLSASEGALAGVLALAVPAAPLIPESSGILSAGRRISDLQRRLDAMKGVDELCIAAEPDLNVKGMSAVRDIVERISRFEAVSQSLKELPSMIDVPMFTLPDVEITKAGKRIMELQGGLESVATQEIQVKDDLSKVTKERSLLMEEIGACPTCQRAFDEECAHAAA